MTTTHPRLLEARREMVALARRTSWSEVSDQFGIELLQLLDWAVEIDAADARAECSYAVTEYLKHVQSHQAQEKLR
jgi:hypothetical protein